MSHVNRSLLRTWRSGPCQLAALVILWGALTATGIGALYQYEFRAEKLGDTPRTWPQESSLPAPRHQPHLVVFAHPRCPCTRATIEELSRIVARRHERLTTTVVFSIPEGAKPGWHQSDLRRSAARIPGVHVVDDLNCVETRRFGALTSGQCALYDEHGILQFTGGITSSRGHAGDNVGSQQILDRTDDDDATGPIPIDEADHLKECSVYGCPLQAPASVEIP